MEAGPTAEMFTGAVTTALAGSDEATGATGEAKLPAGKGEAGRREEAAIEEAARGEPIEAAETGESNCPLGTDMAAKLACLAAADWGVTAAATDCTKPSGFFITP